MADQVDHCSHCRQRISDWEDEQGKALKDPPFEVIELQCPACELLAYHEEEVKEREKGVDAAPRYGIRYGFKRLSED